MITIGTVAVLALLWMTVRRQAYMVALLGVVVGASLVGPAAELVHGGVDTAKTGVTTVDSVIKTSTK